MGADLYITSLRKTAEKQWRPVFEAAVGARDSYIASRSETEAHSKHNDGSWGGKREWHPDSCKLCRLQEDVSKAYDKLLGQGYFRSSYNGASFFWRMGLSWWADVTPMLNKKGVLTVTKARALRKMVADRAIKPATKAELEDMLCTVDDGDNSPEAWTKSWEDGKQELLAFLDQAISMKEGIVCSL